MHRTTKTDQICSNCWNRAIDTFGTGQVFLRRSEKYTKYLQGISFLGILVPLLIGGIVLGFGTKASYLDTIIPIAALVGVLQLILSAMSIAYNWADNLHYALESASENLDLSLKFKELGEQAQSPPDDIELRFTALKTKDEARQATDVKKGVTPKELRYGHRAGLKQFRRTCATCNQIPTSMESSNCGTCGSFK